MKHYYLYTGILISILFSSGCVVTPQQTMTPLQIQALQTRQYEHDKNVVFASVISVFQDLGYTIKSADKETGFITAESPSKSDPFMVAFTGMSQVDTTLATAFVEQIKNMTSVRLNFVASRKTSSAYGRDDKNENAILDAQVYQAAFEKIENAIFVRAAN